MCNNKRISKVLLCFFVLFTSYFAAHAKVDTVIVQLKWRHQYQFAGYYAAQLKGFYKSENIYVKFKEAFREINASDLVLHQRADFAVTGSEIILDYINKKPIVVLASIFQHSPYVIISRKEKKITKPTDLAGKTIYAAKGQGLHLLHSLLKSEGIPLDSVTIKTPLRNPSLLNDSVDAITAYRSGKPIEMEALGYGVSTIDPADYGVDFYGDVLITSKENIENNPEKVERFLAASLKGWKYALQHPDEISDYILTFPEVKERNVRKDLLMKEAKMISSLVRPDLIEIGHMNRGRWENILKVYGDLAVIPEAKRNTDLEDFLYHPEEQSFKYLKRLIVVSAVLLIIAFFFLIRNILIKLNLKKAREKVVQANLKDKISEETINTILEHAGIIIWNWNVTNGEFVAYGGEDKDDFVTKDLKSIGSFKALIHPDSVRKFDLFLNLLPDNLSEEVLIRINSRYEWYMLTAKVRERDENNNPTSFLGLLIDISVLKKKEKNLDKLTVELKKTNSELQKFAYITSHNLRAPVVNLGSLIEFYDYNAADRNINNEVVEKMGVSINQLKNTLEDLIDVVSKKPDTLDFQTLAIQNEIQNITRDLKIESSQIEYDFTQITQVAYPIKSFKTIFSNILSNSINYKNPNKALKVNIKSYDADDYIAIEVSDNGLGIDLEKNKEKMFGLYQRFHPQIKGRGIGLFIVKSQIESLDGKIEVESKLNLGATFTVFFRKRS